MGEKEATGTKLRDTECDQLLLGVKVVSTGSNGECKRVPSTKVNTDTSKLCVII